MVSNARLDLPEPDRPVMTTSLSRGIETSTLRRLCSRAPRMTIASEAMDRSPVVCFSRPHSLEHSFVCRQGAIGDGFVWSLASV